MGKIIGFVLVTLLTAMSLTTRAQEKDTLKVQSDSVARNVSLKEIAYILDSEASILASRLRRTRNRLKKELQRTDEDIK